MYNWKKSYVAYKTEMFEGKTPMSHRLQAVPFWIVERLREIAEREKKLERTSGRGLGELAPVSLRYEHHLD